MIYQGRTSERIYTGYNETENTIEAIDKDNDSCENVHKYKIVKNEYVCHTRLNNYCLTSLDDKKIARIKAFHVLNIDYVHSNGKEYIILHEYSYPENIILTCYRIDTTTMGQLSMTRLKMIKSIYVNIADFNKEIRKGIYLLKDKNSESDYFYLYNIITNKKSKLFEYGDIATSLEVRENVDPKYHNTVLVHEKVENENEDYYRGHVIYGMDLDTFHIVTPIYSYEQDRLIKRYNQKEKLEFYKNINMGKYDMDKLIDPTIKAEVEPYVYKLEERDEYHHNLCDADLDANVNFWELHKTANNTVKVLEKLKRDYRIKK